jgi:hypothetical protein
VNGNGRRRRIISSTQGWLYRIRRAEACGPRHLVWSSAQCPSSCSRLRLGAYRGERGMRTSGGERCMWMSGHGSGIRISHGERCVGMSCSEWGVRTSRGKRRRIGLGCHGCPSGRSGSSHDYNGWMVKTAILQIWVTASNSKDNIVVVAVRY